MAEHRSAERGLYDRLQREEHAAARELLERLLSSTESYDAICGELNRSRLFDSIKTIYPQDLTRYRQRKAQVERRADVEALIASDSEVVIRAAAKNPEGLMAGYLRRMFAESLLTRFEEDASDLDLVKLSQETARHAKVDQDDQKLEIDRQKVALDQQRIELARKQADIQKDRFDIAATTWQFTLAWFVREEPDIADRMARRSEEFLIELEESLGT